MKSAVASLVRRALLAAALASGGAAAAPPATIAVSESLYAAPVLVAEALNYFAEEGLALNVLRCPIGRVCLQHLLDGKAQFATAADTPITLAAFARPRDFGIVATMTTTGPEHRMMVRTDRGLARPADLKGRRIGTLRGTSAHFFTETFLLFHGLRMSDVTLVALDAADPIGPLARGEVDAAGLFDPHARGALKALGPGARALPTPGFFSVTFNLVSVPAAAGGRDEDLVRLLRALVRATTLIRNEPARAQAVLAAALNADRASLAEVWDDFQFRIELTQPLITIIEAQTRWARREKLVPPDAPVPDAVDLLRAAALREVDPRAMRIVH